MTPPASSLIKAVPSCDGSFPLRDFTGASRARKNGPRKLGATARARLAIDAREGVRDRALRSPQLPSNLAVAAPLDHSPHDPLLVIGQPGTLRRSRPTEDGEATLFPCKLRHTDLASE